MGRKPAIIASMQHSPIFVLQSEVTAQVDALGLIDIVTLPRITIDPFPFIIAFVALLAIFLRISSVLNYY